MAKLLCTITTKVYDDGSVEVKTEPYREPFTPEDARLMILGESQDRGKSTSTNPPLFGLG